MLQRTSVGYHFQQQNVTTLSLFTVSAPAVDLQLVLMETIGGAAQPTPNAFRLGGYATEDECREEEEQG